MANQRETKRERREIAKQRRLEELRRRQRRQAMRKFWYGGIAVLVIGAIVVGVMFAGQAGKKKTEDLNKLAPSAGCTKLQSFPNEGNSHVVAPQRVTYGTNPPTSGNHRGQTSFTGVLPNPLPSGLEDENLVHNMEHGHVIVWYKPDLDPSLLDKLTSFVRGNITRRILVVRANMDYEVAITAWQHLVGCQNPTAKVVRVADLFARIYEGHGPENTGDAPGTPYQG